SAEPSTSVPREHARRIVLTIAGRSPMSTLKAPGTSRTAHGLRFPARRPWWRLTREERLDWVLYALLGLIPLLTFDLFGIEDAARTRIQDAFNEIYVAWYPNQAPPLSIRGFSSPPEPSKVAVVLWDENDLVSLEKPWPLPFGAHGRVLRKIKGAR